ncbi:tetratricopeptide repeat protein [Candidatus Methylobacter oryzae]|uniref:Tetratricopeptide repeat protein n=1 Tax=Candidatus Methylobacter oryzae TaxID=2497749 RepID=A0ABY3CD40_9GAMM|nr:tetratricopeptide repeat protein [Candidatus Methylobacter oryzae]TRW97040.1 tetratricopeptide repeat protein [Candidatus Methylobacter oryzae]
MTEIDVIALYGPGNLKPDDLVAGFVAREKTLDYFLNELRHQAAAGASPRHHLIVGQRGMGKTTLLHRIAIAVGERNDLNQALLPLTFREEQYNVINLHVFWRNAIESLLDWLERQGCDEQAKTLEQQLDGVEKAYEQNRNGEVGGDAAWRVFNSACEKLGKRPVLFLDNLDLILDALKKHDWGLRDILQQSCAPIVIGAAAAYPKSLSDRKAAFFDFFRLTTLARLEHHEVRACLLRLAQKRGEAGSKVSELLRRDPGRIDALTEMTGGNPRTLAVLYLLLESQAGEDAFADLEKLLDRMTPLYKARAEEAAPQARAVLDAVALAWDPITAKYIAKASGLEVTVVNAQLKRLENDGFLEKVPVSGSGRSGYQMVERFFNIWYLMRHGSRRLKQRVCWLTAFLRGFYSSDDREDLARGFLRDGNHKGRADLMLALSESVDDPVYRKALSQAAGRDLLQQSETRKRIEQLVDLRDIAPELADMAELEREALAVQRDWPEGLDVKSFWELLGGSLEMNSSEKRRLVEQLPDMSAEQLAELVATLRKEIAELCWQFELDEPILVPYRAAIKDGSIRHRYDLQGAGAAALCENYPDIAAVGCLLIMDGKRFVEVEAITAYRKRFAEETGLLWRRIDQGLAGLTPSSAWDLCWYGLWLEQRGFYSEAEAAYRRAIVLDSADAIPWDNLGTLLQAHLGRYEEAEDAYRQAITLDTKDAGAWSDLGNLLQIHLGRYEEAEAAYRQAIDLNPNLAYPRHGLGYLLQEYLDRYEEAEVAYRQAIALDPKWAYPWNTLGDLLQYNLDRYDEAEAAYRQAIALDPNDAYSWNGLGNLLQDHLGRYEEAEQAYLHALEVADTKRKKHVHGLLAMLYWFALDRPDLARYHAEQGRQAEEEYIAPMLDASQYLEENQAGPAFGALDAALASADAKLWRSFLNRLQRLLRFSISQGYGPKFLEFMQAAGYPDRYAPLYWAFLAALEGKDILLNVNPEARRTAERIYQGLVGSAETPRTN